MTAQTCKVAKTSKVAAFKQARACVRAARAPVACTAAVDRRQLLQTGVLAGAITMVPGAAEAKKLTGFNLYKDAGDGYQFVYPFGWQEVAVQGQDVVYKDVIEPLESIAVDLTPTDKLTIEEYGPLDEVAFTLADKVLTGANQPVKLLSTKEITKDEGRKYYEFEFTVETRNYTRHSLACVTVGNGNLYTVVTGANERRWGKMSEKVKTVITSFLVNQTFSGMSFGAGM